MSDTKNVVVVDVREDLREGREPFQRIMLAANGLQAGQEMELWAPFEPQPLFGVMAGMGFDHEAEAQLDGDWRVRFYRPAAATA
ncbi:MAG TPA: DUF2249 domain-containing protein [Chloroflexota bacterium]|nr:DUF2249 domain-containing protein [Chloroflexota bacterium]